MKRHLWILRILSVAVLVGCGAPPPPAPPVNPAQAARPLLGAYLEDPSPGTPLNQIQDLRSVLSTLEKNFIGDASGTVQKDLAVDYAVTQSYAGTSFKRVGEIPSQQKDSFKLRAYAAGWGDSLNVEMAHANDYGRSFTFAQQINVGGLTLYSTDQVALFEAMGSAGQEILKWNYTSQTPLVQLFSVQPLAIFAFDPYSSFGGLGGGGPTYLRVLQKEMTANYLYRPSQQQQQGPQPAPSPR